MDPPFQVPDEINHFYRAYQISEGRILSVKQDGRVGGELPVSLEGIVRPFGHMCWSVEGRTSAKVIKEAWKQPLHSGERKFMDFPNTALYAPICYAPQAFAISVLRLFGCTPLAIFYGARLFTLLCWILCIYTAIRLLPVCQWLFTFLALLPMSVFINMSLSADVVTNMFSFLFIAITLRYAFDDHPITRKRLLILCIMSFLLVSAKMVYVPLIALVLVIPSTKFPSLRDRLLKLAAIGAIALATAALWNNMANNLYTPYSEYNVQYRVDPSISPTANMHDQKEYILSHGGYIFEVFANTFSAAFDMYYNGYIGTFGWLDTKLPGWLVHCMYLLLFVVALASGDARIQLKPFARMVIGITFLLSLFLLFLSQHLTWDPVGGDAIHNIQGRYLVPFTPLLFLLFYNRRFSAKKIVIPVVMISSLFALVCSSYAIYTRYYGL